MKRLKYLSEMSDFHNVIVLLPTLVPLSIKKVWIRVEVLFGKVMNLSEGTLFFTPVNGSKNGSLFNTIINVLCDLKKNHNSS